MSQNIEHGWNRKGFEKKPTMQQNGPIMESQVPFPYREHSTMKGHNGPVLCVEFNTDGNYCISGGKDRTIKLWNPFKETPVLLKDYSGQHGYEVRDIKVNSDNSQFASCGGDRVAFVWDVATGNVLRRFRGHDNRLNTLGYNRDCSVLVTGSYDKTIRCWDMRAHSRDPIQTLTDFRDSVESLEVSGDTISSCSVDGCVRHHDLRMGQCITDHVCKAMTSIRLSNDGQCVLVSCMDSKLRLFDKSSGELLNEYKGHVNKDYAIESCLTNTDAYIISGSEDNAIYFWNLVEGDLVHRLEGHTRAVSALSYHPKEPILVSASFDGTVKCWK